MNDLNAITPVHYSPGVEKPEADEAETQAELVAAMRSISETTFEHSGHALRSVHAKSHGILRGELQVLDGLPALLKQGIFSGPGRFPVVLRLSTPPGDLLPDKVSTPRGAALKIEGVNGVRLPSSESTRDQDFVMVNGPAFQVPTAKAFLGNVKLLAKTTDKAPGLKEAASAVFRGVEKVVESLGGESPKLKSMGGHAETEILGETFYTQTPIRYGEYIAKISLAPVSPELQALKDAPLKDVDDDADALLHSVEQFFATQGAEWELRVQLCMDRESMPVEDSSVIWPEEKSAYVPVARITLPSQSVAPTAAGDALSFSPWHGVEAHRPLGSINRVRKPAYEMSSQFRASHKDGAAAPGCPVK